MLLQKYLIINKFNSDGAYGTIYSAVDKLTQEIVLVKITENEVMNFKEHNIMRMLTGSSQFPQLYGGGNFKAEGMKQ
jgi:serine/threonine protein kinase